MERAVRSGALIPPCPVVAGRGRWRGIPLRQEGRVGEGDEVLDGEGDLPDPLRLVRLGRQRHNAAPLPPVGGPQHDLDLEPCCRDVEQPQVGGRRSRVGRVEQHFSRESQLQDRAQRRARQPFTPTDDQSLVREIGVVDGGEPGSGARCGRTKPQDRRSQKHKLAPGASAAQMAARLPPLNVLEPIETQWAGATYAHLTVLPENPVHAETMQPRSCPLCALDRRGPRIRDPHAHLLLDDVGSGQVAVDCRHFEQLPLPVMIPQIPPDGSGRSGHKTPAAGPARESSAEPAASASAAGGSNDARPPARSRQKET